MEKLYGVYGFAGKQIISQGKLSTLMGVKQATLRAWAFEYRKNGNKVLPYRKRGGGYKITEPIKNFLLKQSTLEDWKTKSMQERCHMLEEQKNLKITRCCLSRFYKKNKVRNVVPCYRLWRRTSDE